MFRIKICGATTIDDARLIAAAGADAVGFNFYPGSKRHVTVEQAREMDAALPSHLIRVGVFVNSPAADIRTTVEAVGLDAIQLHGDEPPEFLLELARTVATPMIRAFRLGPEGTMPIGRYLHRCAELACPLRMILIDGYRPGSYGGTGMTFDWKLLKDFSREGITPLILAGGLTPENVAEAIETARPAAVDVAGGVESSPGRKDQRLVRAFVAAARLAFGTDFR
ncbi:MAG TPA: phosphoribosylanthranilate isomerase [Planctomycetaceae bacterium]|nr:phosphoribosylanthranilate isomerase [Planctomycetaceae bacterium]